MEIDNECDMHLINNKGGIREHDYVTEHAFTQSEASDSDDTTPADPIEKQIHMARKKARKLNPLRNARRKYTGTDGSNNPNIPGQDNGHNAWMDAQLNSNELDKEMLINTKYAKINSDGNRMYDIDDIPIKGPPKIKDMDPDISGRRNRYGREVAKR